MNQFLFFFFLLCVTFSATAQFHSVPTRINTPYGPRTITTYQYSPTMQYNGNRNPSQKYTFTVVLLNDSTITDKGRIKITDSIHSITFKEKGNKTTFKPFETKELYRFVSKGVKLSGIPADTCWLFKTEEGRVNFYSCVAELGTDLVTAIQIGDDSPITTLDKQKVMDIVSQYPRLLKLAKKNKLVKALRKYNNIQE